MKELSLNILDIAENSVRADATLTEIVISENSDFLSIILKDNGIGMTEKTIESVRGPFFTTRTERKVGMGIPLLEFAAERTGGHIEIESKHIDSYPLGHGTTVRAFFNKGHIDFAPLGDIISTLITLIQGHPDRDFVFVHKKEGLIISLDTREIRESLGDIPLNTFEVLMWIRDNLRDQYDAKI